MPSMRQINDDIADFIRCLKAEPTRTPCGELEREIRVRVARELAMWLEVKEAMRNAARKEIVKQ